MLYLIAVYEVDMQCPSSNLDDAYSQYTNELAFCQGSIHIIT